MSEAAARWQVPSIDGREEAKEGLLTASQLEQLQRDAWDEAYAAGMEEGRVAGLAKAEAEITKRVTLLDELLEAQAAPLAALDLDIERQVVDLAMKVVRQLFRRELKTDPGHVIGVVREAVGLLPVASRELRVHLHPDDAALLRDALSATDGESAWSIVEDPLVTRGGCQITTDTSRVDARNETRLNALIASIAGDERQS